MELNSELLKRALQRLEQLQKQAVVAPGGPPQDPAAAQGGGMPPMDPAMMAGMAQGGGAPPMDPAMMAGMAQGGGGIAPEIQGEQAPADPAAEAATKARPTRGKKDEALNEVLRVVYNIQVMVASIIKHNQIPISPEILVGDPPAGMLEAEREDAEAEAAEAQGVVPAATQIQPIPGLPKSAMLGVSDRDPNLVPPAVFPDMIMAAAAAASADNSDQAKNGDDVSELLKYFGAK